MVIKLRPKIWQTYTFPTFKILSLVVFWQTGKSLFCNLLSKSWLCDPKKKLGFYVKCSFLIFNLKLNSVILELDDSKFSLIYFYERV